MSWRCLFRHDWRELARAPITMECWRKPAFSFDHVLVDENVPGVLVLERCAACDIERGVRVLERCAACDIERGVRVLERCAACDIERGVRDAGDTRTVLSGVYTRSRLEEFGVLKRPTTRPV